MKESSPKQVHVNSFLDQLKNQWFQTVVRGSSPSQVHVNSFLDQLDIVYKSQFDNSMTLKNQRL